MATFKFAKATYQSGKFARPAALKRAAELGATVMIESEIFGDGKSSAFAMRVFDVETGQPILRQQRVLPSPDANFEVAQALVAELEVQLPEKIAANTTKVKPVEAELPTASSGK